MSRIANSTSMGAFEEIKKQIFGHGMAFVSPEVLALDPLGDAEFSS